MNNEKVNSKELKLADIRKKPIRVKVLPAIRSICKRYNADLDDYDVFHLLASEQAYLYLNDDGFMVLQQQISTYERERILFVLVACAFETGKSLLQQPDYHQWLKEMALSINANKVQFCTEREGYQKALPSFWSKRTTTFEWEL